MVFPYTLKTGSLKGFFSKIPLLGKPEKISVRYLYSIGFKSTNDRPIISILKFLKFLNEGGSPTSRYLAYRDKTKSAKILGEAIKESYSDIFSIYPNAHKEGMETLSNYFSTNTGRGDRASKATAETFKALISIADLDGITKNKTKEDKDDILEEDEKDLPEHTSISLPLGEKRKAKIIFPIDITNNEIKIIEGLLTVFKKE